MQFLGQMSVAQRIKHLEAHVETIIAEIASLKLATTVKEPIPINLFTASGMSAPPEPIKELYVLYDFETNGGLI